MYLILYDDGEKHWETEKNVIFLKNRKGSKLSNSKENVSVNEQDDKTSQNK